MAEDLVTYQICKKLKEKGFPITGKEIIYEGNGVFIPTPTFYQVLKWMREEKELHIEFIANASGYYYIISRTPQRGASDLYCGFDGGTNDSGVWDDYEQCVLDAIEYGLDNLI